MMKKISHLFCIAIILVAAICLISASVYADDSQNSCGNNVTWEYDSNTSTLTISGNGAMQDYEKYDNTPWRSYMYEIRYINIEDGVTHIGAMAFTEIHNVAWISVPESVTGIGSYAFPYDSFFDTKIAFVGSTLPAELSDNWNSNAPYYLNAEMKSGTYTDNNYRLTYSYAVINNTSVVLCNILSCEKLQFGEIYFPEHIDNLPIIEIGSKCFYYLSADTVHLPETIEIIGEKAFDHSWISSIQIPSRVKRIEDYAFNNCTMLKKVSLPDDLEFIGTRAFSCCSILPYISIPENISEIGSYAFAESKNLLICFRGTSLPETLGEKWNGNAEYIFSPDIITDDNYVYEIRSNEAIIRKYIGDKTNPIIPAQVENIPVTEISESAFKDSSILNSITIPDTIKSVGDYAFFNCVNLTKCTLQSAETILGKYIFYQSSKLKTVEMPDELETIPEGIFYGCGLTKINLPEKLVTICDYALAETKLSTVNLPESIKSINKKAFYNCDQLSYVVLGKNIDTIQSQAFSNCSNLKAIVISGDINEVQNNAFGGSAELCIYVNSESIPETWGSNWNSNYTFYLGEAGLIDNLFYRIENGEAIICFYTYPSTSAEVTIPDYINGYKTTVIQQNAFKKVSYSNGSISKVIIPDTIKRIEKNAFYNCQTLNSVKLSASLESIGEQAFSGCEALSSISFPASLQTIGQNAFYGCSSLTYIKIPDKITSIENYTFSRCKNLKKVTFSEGLKCIGDYAFDSCNHITDLHFPDSLEIIERNAFSNINYLEKVELNAGLKEIGDNAFNSCDNLNWIEIPDSVTIAGSKILGIGVIYLNHKTIPEGFNTDWNGRAKYITDIRLYKQGDYIFGIHSNNTACLCKYTGSDSEPNIPTAYGSAPLTEIGYNAFTSPTEDNKTLKSIVLPDSIEIIMDSAFKHTYALEYIHLPEKLKSIGVEAFYYSNIASIDFPESLERIESRAFAASKLSGTIIIPEGVNYLGDNCFSSVKAYSIVIPASVTGSFSSDTINSWISGSSIRKIICRVNSPAYNFLKDNNKTFVSFTDKDFIVETNSPVHIGDQVECRVYYYNAEDNKKVYVQDFELKYDTTQVGKSIVVITGTGKYEGTISKNIKILPKTTDVSRYNIQVQKTVYTYSGAKLKPAISVRSTDGILLKEKEDYMIAYSGNLKNVGTHKITVKGVNGYTGNKTIELKIIPKGTSISKLIKSKKSFTVKWKTPSSSQLKQITGYQIQYSTSSTFKSHNKYVSIKSNKTTYKKITKLKSKKKYYVRVRSYKTINGAKYYSSWSSKKTVITR